MQKGSFKLRGAYRTTNWWWRQIWTIQLTCENRLQALACVQGPLARLRVDNSGAVAAEYTFLIAFISILSAFGMVFLGEDLLAYFQSLGNALDNAADPTPDPFAT